MEALAQTLPKKVLPDRIHRELRKGETLYHSILPCHVSKKNPEGKWIAQVRREEKGGKLIKYPVKGFATPKDALDYVKSLRPNDRGEVKAVRKSEPSVSDLYEYVKLHRQKRLAESTKSAKEGRWRMYIEPEWADWPLSKVTRRSAQEWVTKIEDGIDSGDLGTLGIAQLEKIRSDLHSLFDALPSFSSDYEDRRNPFAELDFVARAPRAKVTIESQHFAAIDYACRCFADEGLCTRWIVEVFLTSLFSGLRQGEVLALCRDQLDFENGAITVDRALRRVSRPIDPRSRLEVGPVQRQAINYPKGGTPTHNKTRVVPMSDQLIALLKGVSKRPHCQGDWDLLWPSDSGVPREVSRFRNTWVTLRDRLNEVATLAPISGDGEWPDIPKRQGWARNSIVLEARERPDLLLPDIFGNIDFRDTRNSFASYMNELGLSQATREQLLGHNGGLTNSVYTTVTSGAFQDAKERLTKGWKPL